MEEREKLLGSMASHRKSNRVYPSGEQETRSKSCPICGEVFAIRPGTRRRVLNTKVRRHVNVAHHYYHREATRWNGWTQIHVYLGALALFYLFVGVCGRYGDCGPPIIRASIYSPFFPVTLGIFIAPIIARIVLRRIVREEFRNEWQAAHGLTSTTDDGHTQTVPVTPTPTGSDYEDGQHPTVEGMSIIDTVRDLSGRLGVKFPVHFVRWLPSGLPSDDCAFGIFDPDEIDLPSGLKGKLDVDELRPLIASSMIYEFKLEKRRVSSLLGLLLTALSLVVFWTFLAITFTLGSTSQAITGTIATTFFAISVVLSQWFGARVRQRQRLKADKSAARVVGKESLLRTLKRIDALGLRDIEGLKQGGWKTHFAEDPSIARRIDALSAKH
jgi:hypothetical protein